MYYEEKNVAMVNFVAVPNFCPHMPSQLHSGQRTHLHAIVRPAHVTCFGQLNVSGYDKDHMCWLVLVSLT